VAFVQTACGYHNMEAGADLFSAVNVPFWEYALPAFDAAGTIIAGPSSYAVRASALQVRRRGHAGSGCFASGQ
jgi:hypothetical protein